MRTAVALLVGVLLVSGCTSTVAGQAGADGAALPRTVPTVAATPGASDSATAPTGTTPQDTVDTAGTSPSPTVDEPPEIPLPPGFYDAGANLGYRPMTTDEFDCTQDQVSGCFGIMVFSAPGCPAGAQVTVGIFDKATDPDHPIGSATGTTPPIAPDGSAAVVIGDSTGVDASLTARVQQVVC